MRNQRANQIYKLMTYESENMDDQIHYVLKESTLFLGADLGIISHINGDEYEVIDFYSVNPTELQKGQVFELGNTYCSITYQEDNIVDINHMGKSEHSGHPCYDLFGLETYIGVPIWINGERYGTLNFSSADPRNPGFSTADFDFVFIMGQLISTGLTRFLHEKELVKKNEKLKDQNGKLEELIEENRGMTHMMVHDLRAPVTNIKILSGMIEESVTGKDSELTFNHLKQELSKAEQLINELNYMNKLEHAEIRMEIEPLNVVGLLESVIDNYQGAAETKSLELRFMSDGHDHSIKTDKLALIRITDNLVSNAIKFSPFGKQVTIVVRQDQDDLIIEVRDQGPGFTELDRTKMFQKFQVLSARPTNKEVSTGLGLAIVKALAKKLNYRIEVDSILGEGSTFRIIMESKREQVLA